MLGMELIGAVASAATMQPVGPWNLDQSATGCVLARAYGVGRDQTLVGFRALPLGDRVEVLIRRRGGRASPLRGMMRWSLGPDAVEVVPFEAFNDGARRLTRFTVPAARLAALPDAVAMTATPSTGGAVSVTIEHGDRMMTALARCNADAPPSWSVDVAQQRQVATPPRLMQDADLLGRFDRPRDRRDEGRKGEGVLVWRVGPDGRADRCVAASPSGLPDVDAAACRTIEQRARYAPALDRAGKPVAAYVSREVRWDQSGSWNADRAYLDAVAKARRTGG